MKIGADDFLAGGGDLEQLAATAFHVATLTGGHSERPSQSSVIVELAGDFELFHDPAGTALATIPIRHQRETHPLRTKAVRSLLAARYFEHTGGKAAGAQAVQDAIAVLEGRALFASPMHSARIRVAHVGEAVYLDLADDHWRVVEIDAHGWRMATDPPVKFRRARGLLALPEPQRGGSLDDLRRFVNISNDDDWRVYVGWVGAILSPGPYPVLCLHGEPGSAKSTVAHVSRRLVDPNVADLRPEPRDNRDLIIAASNGWVVALDNISRVRPDLSDALCRLSTGGGFGTRELYSDGEETLFDAMRPVIINGVSELATRGDLLDRSIILYLPAIAKNSRRPETEFWADFEAARPRLLGALLTAVSGTLAHRASTRLDQLPRMADFAIWVTAMEPSLGWPPGSFLESYEGNRRDVNDLALDASPLVAFVRVLANDDGWQGTATELLKAIDARADDATRRQRGWPGNGRALSNALRRLAPNLRAAGIEVSFETPHGQRVIRLRKGTESSVPSVPAFHLGTNDAESGTQTAPGGTQNEGGGTQNPNGNAGNANIPTDSDSARCDICGGPVPDADVRMCDACWEAHAEELTTQGTKSA